MRRLAPMIAVAALSLAAAPGPSFAESASPQHGDQPARKYRSRGAQAKPKKRPNMRHVSKRVRRKHRRAA